ncbi:hypothetical protein IQ251_06470 [Saccharopolyspora sp. HNM0983]|uniref:Uncharacterized protein n=1 Tax=Saccharopolyspora montiporae TaxID=2781240 RepID=A0A929FZ23_9PSEU|nr:hypothetical protein [Saccharopolyspora sp. HNM0983]MBE9374090.1 hypothetical protein [Saccharopolyspora sp. HNM0983]
MNSRDDRTRRDGGSDGSGEGTGTGSGVAKSEVATSDVAEDKSLRSQVSIPQVSGAALASVTAAFLGSQLGVAGTIVGAGMTSVIITVGGVLYQRSLEKTKEKAVQAKVKAQEKAKVQERARAHGKPGVQGGAADKPARRPATSDEPVATRRIEVGSGMHWPGGELVDGPEPTSRSAPPAARAESGPDRAGGEDTRVAQVAPDLTRKRRVRAVVAAGTCAAAFAVAMVVVTGFEGVTGKPLSGGDDGTTVGRVLQPRPEPAEPPEPEPEPAPAETSEPSTALQTTSEQPGTTAPSSGQQQPTGTGTREPQPTGSGSADPSGSTQQSSGEQRPEDQPGGQRLGETAPPSGAAG